MLIDHIPLLVPPNVEQLHICENSISIIYIDIPVPVASLSVAFDGHAQHGKRWAVVLQVPHLSTLTTLQLSQMKGSRLH